MNKGTLQTHPSLNSIARIYNSQRPPSTKNPPDQNMMGGFHYKKLFGLFLNHKF